uniref:Uncharacterized protein n=1 Tax=Physcomitrium patens TaxID=3218 RepID=A0A7I4BJV6_PHYPA
MQIPMKAFSRFRVDAGRISSGPQTLNLEVTTLGILIFARLLHLFDNAFLVLDFIQKWSWTFPRLQLVVSVAFVLGTIKKELFRSSAILTRHFFRAAHEQI